MENLIYLITIGNKFASIKDNKVTIVEKDKATKYETMGAAMTASIKINKTLQKYVATAQPFYKTNK